jgi:hypothetical protein
MPSDWDRRKQRARKRIEEGLCVDDKAAEFAVREERNLERFRKLKPLEQLQELEDLIEQVDEEIEEAEKHPPH